MSALPWLGFAALVVGIGVLAGVSALSWRLIVVLALGGVVLGVVGLVQAASLRGRGAGFGVAGMVAVAVGAVVAFVLPIALGTADRGEAEERVSDLVAPQPSPVRLVPDWASASSTAPNSTDGSGTPVSFLVSNVVDGDTTTAWRSDGSPLPAVVILEFDRPVHLSGLVVIPGYAKVDPRDGTNRFAQNARVREAVFALDDGTTVEHTFADQASGQPVVIEGDTTSVRITVQSVYRGTRPYVAISEVALVGWER